MSTIPQTARDQSATAGCLCRLVRVACLICRVLTLAIASVLLLPFIGIIGLWDEWKAEIKMIRDGC